MIRATLIGSFIVSVTGFDMEAGGKQFWRTALQEYGQALQEKIADSFANERVAGSSALAPNSPEYNARKAREGMDTRRGHRTNFLQSVLDGAPLFQVGAVTGNKKGTGTARIQFMENWLHSRVPYAEYYEAAKVRRAGILALARSWLNETVGVLNAIEAKALLKQRRAAERSRVRNPRYAVGQKLGKIIRFGT